MGTWGHDFFENDTAQDFLEELPTKQMSGYIETIISGDTHIDYLEYDTCIQILIIGEIIAANMDGDYSRFPENFQNKLKNQDLKISPEIKITTIDLIIKLREHSEIRDLYREVEELPLLEEKIIDLLARVER